MVEDGDQGNKRNQEEEVEEQDEKEVIVSVAKLQEQLDEIRTNMAMNNGRLDDIVLNKLLNIFLFIRQVLYTRESFSISFRSDVCSECHERACLRSTVHIVSCFISCIAVVVVITSTPKRYLIYQALFW